MHLARALRAIACGRPPDAARFAVLFGAFAMNQAKDRIRAILSAPDVDVFDMLADNGREPQDNSPDAMKADAILWATSDPAGFDAAWLDSLGLESVDFKN